MIAIVMGLITYPYLDLFMHRSHNRYKKQGCDESQAFLAEKKSIKQRTV